MPLDPNGIWIYEETDAEATASDLLNLGQEATSTRIGELQDDVDAKAPTIVLTPPTVLPLAGNFNLSNGGLGRAPRYQKYGRVAEVEGAIYPANSTVAGQINANAQVLISSTNLPADVRPARTRTFVCQGSGSDRWALQVASDGALTVARYGPASATSTSWLDFSVSWITAN